jgi:phage shock protein C
MKARQRPEVLRRSRDKLIAGVCRGIAEWIGWSAKRVRIAYVLVSLFSAGFPGIGVYLLLWFLMPPPDRTEFRLNDFREQ